MPYKITKSGSKFKVMKKDGSKTFGTHSSRKKAKKQIAAFFTNLYRDHQPVKNKLGKKKSKR